MDPCGNVVVVEDDQSMRGAIERLLNAAGFATVVYASAEELLVAGPGESDVCVISDLKLSGMSGLELLAEMRARRVSQPLILITAHDSPSVRKDAEQSGVAAYLAKPFLGSTLVAAVRNAIRPS
jgi:FixJ family two-component response regulator